MDQIKSRIEDYLENIDLYLNIIEWGVVVNDYDSCHPYGTGHDVAIRLNFESDNKLCDIFKEVNLLIKGITNQLPLDFSRAAIKKSYPSLSIDGEDLIEDVEYVKNVNHFDEYTKGDPSPQDITIFLFGNSSERIDTIYIYLTNRKLLKSRPNYLTQIKNFINKWIRI